MFLQLYWLEKQRCVTYSSIKVRSSSFNLLDFKVVYRRYASLFFIAGIDLDDNELISLEIIHRYVEILDKWFLNVCELDIIFNFSQAYSILGIEFLEI